MSKLANKLEAVRGEDRTYWRGPFGVTVRQHNERLEWQMATAYDVRALFSARVFVRDPDGVRPEQVEHAKRNILEEVFGEFRLPIRRLYAAIDELDVDKGARPP